jgi:hypothetical protein
MVNLPSVLPWYRMIRHASPVQNSVPRRFEGADSGEQNVDFFLALTYGFPV